MVRIALVRKPGDIYPKCVSNHPQKHDLNLFKAHEQHEMYCNTLKEIGLELIYVPGISNYADSCFVEDTVVTHNDRALVCNMGEKTRKGEEKSVEEILKQYFEIFNVHPPGTIEGGDVIHFKDKLISGITQRTNIEGTDQLRTKLEITVDEIIDKSIIHLKSYVTAIAENLIMVTKNYANHPLLSDYKKIIVPQNEEYAANTLTVNSVVILPEGYPKVKQKLQESGFDVIPLQMSEFQKCEGALTCLSILF
jgi:dimethylargininase